jgi:hypothetical protein
MAKEIAAPVPRSDYLYHKILPSIYYAKFVCHLKIKSGLFFDDLKIKSGLKRPERVKTSI